MNGSDEFVSLGGGYPTKGVAHSASQEATLSVQHQIKTKRIRAVFFVTGEDAIELVKACPDVEQARSVLYDIANRLHQERPSVDLVVIENMMDNIRLCDDLGEDKVRFSEGFSLLQRASKEQDGKWTIAGETASDAGDNLNEMSDSGIRGAAGYDSTNSFGWTTYTVGKPISEEDQNPSATETMDGATSSLAFP